MEHINIKWICLKDPETFDERFYQKARNAQTYEEAYLQVEKEYRSVFGKNKYSNYESYRKSRSRRQKSK